MQRLSYWWSISPSYGKPVYMHIKILPFISHTKSNRKTPRVIKWPLEWNQQSKALCLSETELPVKSVSLKTRQTCGYKCHRCWKFKASKIQPLNYYSKVLTRNHSLMWYTLVLVESFSCAILTHWQSLSAGPAGSWHEIPNMPRFCLLSLLAVFTARLSISFLHQETIRR